MWLAEARSKRLGSLDCTSCGDSMKIKRACCKPGYNHRGKAAYVSTSLRIATEGQPARLDECPLGLVIRESPYIFHVEAISAACENAGLDIFTLPRWAYIAAGIYNSEKHRIWDDEREDRALKSQANYGQRQLQRLAGNG